MCRACPTAPAAGEPVERQLRRECEPPPRARSGEHRRRHGQRDEEEPDEPPKDLVRPQREQVARPLRREERDRQRQRRAQAAVHHAHLPPQLGAAVLRILNEHASVGIERNREAGADRLGRDDEVVGGGDLVAGCEDVAAHRVQAAARRHGRADRILETLHELLVLPVEALAERDGNAVAHRAVHLVRGDRTHRRIGEVRDELARSRRVPSAESASVKTKTLPDARAAASFSAESFPRRGKVEHQRRTRRTRVLDGVIVRPVGRDDDLDQFGRVVGLADVGDLRRDDRVLVVRGDDHRHRDEQRRAVSVPRPDRATSASRAGYPACDPHHRRQRHPEHDERRSCGRSDSRTDPAVNASARKIHR